MGSSGGGSQVQPGSGNVPIYRVLKAGEITMAVNLWGFVGGPGHYEVPASTTLVDLLSYAGGPTPSSRLTDIRVIHADTTYEKRVEVFNLNQWFETGDGSQNPYLLTGDTIVVSGRALDVFFQTVSIITNIMVIVTALINFISFTGK
jgi:protein involved in polysaccharide export with SLBB domain